MWQSTCVPATVYNNTLYKLASITASATLSGDAPRRISNSKEIPDESNVAPHSLKTFEATHV